MNCLIYKVLQDPSWQSGYFELALTDKNTQVRFLPCPFTGPKMFCAGPNFWASPKMNGLVPLQKLLCRHKNQFYWMQIIFLSGTNHLWLPQYVNKFFQNIFGPVKGQGISLKVFNFPEVREFQFHQPVFKKSNITSACFWLFPIYAIDPIFLIHLGNMNSHN